MSFRLSSKMPSTSRIDLKQEAKKKFFFVLEGEKTESIYIKAISQYTSQNLLVDIVILERVIASESNQYKITSRIEDYLKVQSGLDIDIVDELRRLAQCYEDEEMSEEELMAHVTSILGDKAEVLITQLNENIINQIYALNKINTYEEGFDKICLVLDRDYRSFKEEQYDKVIDICERSNFLLGVTNPNFEFYLLLHINNCNSFDKEVLRTNPKQTSNKKYVEYTLNRSLNEYQKSYRKNKYDANFFIDKYPDYKKNIENYQQDNMLLKSELGSSVHLIINQLLDQNR